jgi:hypothetical protein
VVSAVAYSPTVLWVTFDRNVQGVLADGSQFTFDNGLTAVSANANGKIVALTTSTQTWGTSYTVTVASTVTDLLGKPIGTPKSATFSGFTPTAEILINEINANITGGCDLIELRVKTSGTVQGFQIRERTGNVPAGEMSFTFPNMLVNKNDFIILHLNKGSNTCNPGGAIDETTTLNQQPAATFTGNYDMAYDWYADDAGLTNTDNVLTIYNGAGTIIEAVLLTSDSVSTTASAASEAQAAVVAAANQWRVFTGGNPAPNGFVDYDFNINAALDLDFSGTTPSGYSIQRVGDFDSNSKLDFGTLATPSWGALNVNQSAF